MLSRDTNLVVYRTDHGKILQHHFHKKVSPQHRQDEISFQRKKISFVAYTITITMVENKSCRACGSTCSLPEEALFCPHCGHSLLKNMEDPNTMDTPLAAAIPIFNIDHPAAASSTSTQISSTGSECAALYFKNPTVDMLRKNENQLLGGILFIATSNQNGKFTVPKYIYGGAILSGIHLDLSAADFVHPETKINAGTILGGLKLIVPRGVRVETRGVGILGGFKGLNTQNVHAGQDAPLVTVYGLAILGGLKVTVNENVPPVRIVP